VNAYYLLCFVVSRGCLAVGEWVGDVGKVLVIKNTVGFHFKFTLLCFFN